MVTTIYKRKDRKVHPVDDEPSDRTVPEGDPFWKLKKLDITKQRIDKASNLFLDLITLRFSTSKPYSRLTDVR
jgi:hypothetical protein